TTINGGKLALSGSGSIATSSKVDVANAAGTFDISATTAGATITSLTGVANSHVTLGAQTLTLSNANDTYAGIIQGTGGLTLTAGTQTLTGTNTYTGATTINGGSLVLNGGGSTIAASAKVSMTGTGDLTLSDGETIKSLAGASGDTVTLGANTLTLSNAATDTFA